MFDTEWFIRLVETRPAIWDTRSKSYSNKLVRMKAWEEICLKIIDGFGELNKEDRDGRIAYLQKKWKHVRDSYRREVIKKRTEMIEGGSTESRKEYVFFAQCSFLSKLSESKLSESNGLMEEHGDNEESLNEGIKFLSEQQSEGVKFASEPRNEGKKCGLEPVPKRKKPSVSGSSQNTPTTSTTRELEAAKEDSDKQFLMSLLHHLKSVPDSSKLDCQCEMMQVVKMYKPPNMIQSRQDIAFQSESFAQDDQELGVLSAPSHTKRKIDEDQTEELLSLACKRLKENPSESDKAALFWADELGSMDKIQRIHAKKAINDILYEGQLGSLPRNSVGSER